MAELIRAEGLTAGYGESIVLEDVSLAIDEGGSLALLGRNGVGKTTLLLTLMGLTRLQQGRLALQGNDITRLPAWRRAHAGLGWVPQERFMFPSLTVEEHLTVVERAGGPWNLQRAYKVFPRLEERRVQQAGTLSGGEQQMLALGRAIMARPRLLLLDEPSLGLAPLVVKEIFAALTRMNSADGVTVVVVEQNATLALSASARAFVLEVGRVAVSGPSEELRRAESVRKSYLGY